MTTRPRLFTFRGHVSKAHLGADLAHQVEDAVAVAVHRLHGLNEELLIGQHDGRSSAAAGPGISFGSRST